MHRGQRSPRDSKYFLHQHGQNCGTWNELRCWVLQVLLIMTMRLGNEVYSTVTLVNGLSPQEVTDGRLQSHGTLNGTGR